MRYFAFCDPSGGASDSMTLAIARTAILGNKIILVGAWERKAPFNPDAVTEEFAGILKRYDLSVVTGDKYAGAWVPVRFREHDITYRASEKTRSEIYLEFLALANSDRIRIPNNRRLRAQLVSLERRTSRAGRDTVDHPPGAHDDLANVVAGVLALAAGQPARREPIACVLELGVREGPWRDPQAGKNLNDPFLDLPGERWTKIN